jgi:hypothetical protein
MDALARLLDAPRGRDAYLVRTTLAAPWSIRLADGAPLGLVAVLHGSAWITGDDGLSVELRAGDVAVAKGAGRRHARRSCGRAPGRRTHARPAPRGP